MPSKFSGFRVKAGDTLRFESPMGGGYGAPLERDHDDVLADVRDDLVSELRAREDYGVVLSSDGREIDEPATTNERTARA
jgi:N-methylhydantoinase B